jgi:hypothetical protein
MKHWTKQAILSAKLESQNSECETVPNSHYLIKKVLLHPSLEGLVSLLSFDEESRAYLMRNPPTGMGYSRMMNVNFTSASF